MSGSNKSSIMELQEMGPLKPEARSMSQMTLFFDFDSLPIIMQWMREQRSRIQNWKFYNSLLLKTVFFLIEWICIGVILFEAVKGHGTALGHLQLSVICILWFGTFGITIYMKTVLDRTGWQQQGHYLPNRRRDFFNSFVALCRPWSFWRAISDHKIKGNVLRKAFCHSEVLSAEKVNFLLGMDRDDMISARDELYDSFIHKLPLAIGLFSSFCDMPTAPSICNLADAYLILLVVTYLVGIIQACHIYERKRIMYCYTLHIYGYLETNGQFSIPPMIENRKLIAFRLILITTSLLFRFFLITFLATISWPFAQACLLFTLVFMYFLHCFCPFIVSSTENLPIGVPTLATCIIDMWINSFYGYSMKTKTTFKKGESRCMRICKSPLVFITVFTVFVPYAIILALFHVKSFSEPKDTGNGTVCEVDTEFGKYGDIAASNFAVIMEFLGIFVHNPYKHLLSFYLFHWILLYIYLIVASLRDYYAFKTGSFDLSREYFPPSLYMSIYRTILVNVFRVIDSSNEVVLFSRLFLFMASELEEFHSIQREFEKVPGFEQSSEADQWWEKKVVNLLQKSKLHAPMPVTPSLPVTSDIARAFLCIRGCQYGYPLYILTSKIFMDAAMKEITSKRLDLTIDTFRFPNFEFMKNLPILDVEAENVYNELYDN